MCCFRCYFYVFDVCVDAAGNHGVNVVLGVNVVVEMERGGQAVFRKLAVGNHLRTRVAIQGPLGKLSGKERAPTRSRAAHARPSAPGTRPSP